MLHRLAIGPLLLALLLALPAPPHVRAGTAAVAPVPVDLTLGPGGAVWLLLAQPAGLARLGPAGVLQLFPLPVPVTLDDRVAAGADGNLWLTSVAGNALLRMTPAGAVTRFPLAARVPLALLAAPDHHLYFLGQASNTVDRVSFTPSGGITIDETALVPADSLPTTLAWATDGLWVSLARTNEINHRPWHGPSDRFALGPRNRLPGTLAVDRARTLWFTEPGADGIGLLTPTGNLHEYHLAGGTTPADLLISGDGTVWCTAFGAHALLRIRPGAGGGALTAFPLPPGHRPLRLVPGADGTLWFNEPGRAVLGHAVPRPGGRLTITEQTLRLESDASV